MQTLLDAIGQLLAAGGVGFYSTTEALPTDLTPICVAGFPAEGDEAVVLTTYPGPEADTRNGWEYPRLQVRVRSADPLAALALDRAVFAVLQFSAGTQPFTLPGGTWLLQDAYAMQSEAQPMGRDTNQRWEFSRNYQLSTEPLT